VEQVDEGRRGRPRACCRPPAGHRGPSRAHAAGAGPGSSRVPVRAYTPPADAPARAPVGRSVCRCGARAQWAGAAAGQQVGAPRPPPPAAALALRAEAPGGGGGEGRSPRRRRWSRWTRVGADVHVLVVGRQRAVAGRRGPTRPARARAAVACRCAPTSPPQMRTRPRQRAAQCAGAARAHSGPAQQRGSRSDRVLLNVPARDSVVIQDKIHATRPAQIVAGVDLVIVIAPAFIHPGINVGKRYRARVPLVNLEFSVAEYPARWQTLRALTSALRL